MKTTEAPINTTEVPIKTTEVPIKTTQEPIKTTEEPIKTTEEPIKTTEEPIETTEEPIKTEQKFKTTATPEQTTEPQTKSTAVISTEPQVTHELTTHITMALTEILTTSYTEVCVPGHFWNGTSCDVCPEDQYSSYGSSCCTSCPEGTTSRPGSTSIDDCVEPIEECEDAALVSRKCVKWAEKGYCSAGEHISFMETECRKSCGFCLVFCEAGYGMNSRGKCQMCPVNTYSEYKNQECNPCPADTLSPKGSTDISACVERDRPCTNGYSNSWCEASVTLGRCRNKPRRMKSLCAKSCGFCDGDEDSAASQCSNLIADKTCSWWRSSGFCYDTQTEHLMTMLCGKTCGTCRSGYHPANCFDVERFAEDCPRWAASGYCTTQQFAVFMLSNCAKSCEACQFGVVTSVPPPVTTTATPPAQHCWISDVVMSLHNVVDRGALTSPEDCIERCKMNYLCKGVMVSPVSWMAWGSHDRECFLMGDDVISNMIGWTVATRSCFEPTPTTPTPEVMGCADSKKYAHDCPRWASTDSFCETGQFRDFMAENCRESCGFCGSFTGSEPCGDSMEHLESCNIWSTSGYCTEGRFKVWMSEYCPRSCGLCKDVSCYDVNYMCGRWSESGYCVQSNFIQYMRDSCPAACGFC